MKPSRNNDFFLSPIRTITVGAGLRSAGADLHRLNPRMLPEFAGCPGNRLPPGFTAGAGIPPAPESYLKLNYHTVITRTRKALALGNQPPDFSSDRRARDPDTVTTRINIGHYLPGSSARDQRLPVPILAELRQL